MVGHVACECETSWLHALTEPLLDALGIVVVSPGRLAALEQALQENVLRADEEEDGRARDDLMMSSVADELISHSSSPVASLRRSSQSCQTRWPGPSGAENHQ